MVVNRNCDGGGTMEMLGNGLPQSHAYHLICNHGLTVNRTGHRLVVGSTTGGSWVSDDGGKSWQTISSHIPPVYCVGFVQ